MLNFLVKSVEKGKKPPVEGLDLLKLQIQAPMLWSESYKLFGENEQSYTLYGDDRTIHEYSSAQWHAVCLVCQNYKTEKYEGSENAIHAHFMHCARNHGYIFPENYDKSKLAVADKVLQYLIQDCQVYNLPFYGYDDHTGCIMQFRMEPDSKRYTVCAIHKGNEYQHDTRNSVDFL